MAWAKRQEWYSSRQRLKTEAGASSQRGVLEGKWVEKHDAQERGGAVRPLEASVHLHIRFPDSRTFNTM